MVKSLPAVWETQVWSLGQEDPLEKEMATHSSILAWKNPMDGGAWGNTVHGVAKSRPWLKDFMKLEPIIQSEVSEKEKHQYGILMHIYGT